MFRALKTIQAGNLELQDRAEFFWCGSNLVLVVADGAGGRSGGAEAADVEGTGEKLISPVRYQSGAFPDDVGIVLAQKT
jgi:hypothetical protein